MSMNPGQEHFHELRRLLALKRHEQPPPGYFNDFSVQVIARIRAGEHLGDESILDSLFGHAPWVQRVWSLLESKPVLVGAAGAAFCGLMLAVVLASERVDTTPTSLMPTVAEHQPNASAVSVAQDQTAPTPLFTRTEAIDLSNPSAAPVPAGRTSLFKDFEKAQQPWVGSPVQVNFSLTEPPGH